MVLQQNGTHVDRSKVLNDILLNKFDQHSTTHKKNLYSGTFNNQPILVMRQVDDISVALPWKETALAFIAALGQHVKLRRNDLLATFNGVQVKQSSEYIQHWCAWSQLQKYIGYILIKLVQFSTSSASIHYTCLKRVALYLRNTKHWGITFWRPTCINDLPPLLFPLAAYVNAACATDWKNRQTVTGFIITLCSAAICDSSKLQPTIATSSTKAEFIAAVTAAKSIKYLWSVLMELRELYKNTFPTILYKDNTTAIEMINSGKPTNRTWHVDIQLVTIKEWKNSGDIILAHIPGIINIANALTKALGWVLHNCHNCRAMGHFFPPWTRFTSWLTQKIHPSTTSMWLTGLFQLHFRILVKLKKWGSVLEHYFIHSDFTSHVTTSFMTCSFTIHESKKQCRDLFELALLSSQSLIPPYLDSIIV
jgi:hypothetical protein